MFTYHPKPILLGTDVHGDAPVWLSPDWLKTHIQVLGPPGTGKTRGIILPLFQQLIRRHDATVILMNPKGNLCQLARDAVIKAGLTKRLVLFDPAEEQTIIGYNPLKPNGLSVPTHAKAVREAIRSAWGQESFDGTAQLARFLFLALCATRELEMTLVEAVQVLRAGSIVRAQMLRRLKNPFVKEALEYFDSLREARQEELAASTLARLEAFIMDDTIRRILTQQTRSLDMASVIENKEILLVDLQQFKPLRPDDVRLLGRLIVNDVVSHVFSRPGRRTPVFLLIDECHTFATQDLCLALDQGRELGLHCVLAHQYPKQLLREDQSGLLYGSVTDCARTKIVFGGMSVENIEGIAKELFLCEFDTKKVKDEIRSLELEPVESVRTVRTFTKSGGSSTSRTQSRTKGQAWMHGTSETQGESDSVGSSVAQVTADNTDDEQTIETTNTSHTTSRSFSTQQATTDSVAEQLGTGTTEESGWSVSVALTPFYEYIKRRCVSSRTFESFEEFLIRCMQALKRQPLGHFVLKVPSSAPVFVRALFVHTPWVSSRLLGKALQRVYARPCYGRPAEIEQEEAMRLASLQETSNLPAKRPGRGKSTERFTW